MRIGVYTPTGGQAVHYQCLSDRQVLYANYGWHANLAPAAVAGADMSLLTHADLSARRSLSAIATDAEGDPLYWRVLGASHGSAKIAAGGASSGIGAQLQFTPDPGYIGAASIEIQADDGYASSLPITLTVNVSGAKLLAIRLTGPAVELTPGQAQRLHAQADFEDQRGVEISAADTGNGSYLTVTANDLSSLGHIGPVAIQVDDALDQVRAIASGPALITLSHTDRDGRVVRAEAAINIATAPVPASIVLDAAGNRVDTTSGEGDDSSGTDPFVIVPDVYLGTLTLLPGMSRRAAPKANTAARRAEVA